MRYLSTAGTVVAIALVVASGATGAREQAAGTLEIDVTFRQYWRVDRAYCPPGTPSAADCLRSEGKTGVSGLGRVTSTYKKLLPGDDENCFMIQNNTTLLEVSGKGTLDLSRPGRICAPGPPPRVDGPWVFTVSDGSGTYARASGSLTFKSSVYAGDPACRCGTAIDTWTGELTVPDLEFDTAPPAIVGAVSKTVRMARRAKRKRVRYAVTARDAVDGTVPVACKPRSGSWFRRGRTRVRCSASDSSANTSQARFTVTVR